MAEESSKLWLQSSLNRVAVRRVHDVVQSLGRRLPCRVTAINGAIVTVAFEIQAAPWTLPEITIPKAESPWIRMPTQVGDLGWTETADAYLGGVSGLGGGVATTAPPANLGALVFVPISNANSPPIDPNAAQVQGPNGAILKTTTGTTSSVVTNTSGTTITFGTTVLTINASGITMTVGGKTYTFTATDATMDGIAFGSHVHGGVQPGSSNTTGPV